MDEARYRIGTVARLTGLTTHVIRVWERRYGGLAPRRSRGGARLYSDADLDRLRLLKRALDRGHAIGQVAHLDRAALSRLILPQGDADAEDHAAELVDAVRRFDLPRAEHVLARAAVSLSPRALVAEVLGPALHRVGEEWAAGNLCVASEHAASVLVRDRVAAMLRTYSPKADAEIVVVTTPAGELHELGALFAAVTASMQGFRVVYLGPNLPAGEIAAAVRGSGAGVVALSIVVLDVDAAARELQALRSELPPEVVLVLGGARGPLVAEVATGVVASATLLEFEAFLAARAAR